MAQQEMPGEIFSRPHRAPVFSSPFPPRNSSSVDKVSRSSSLDKLHFILGPLSSTRRLRGGFSRRRRLAAGGAALGTNLPSPGADPLGPGRWI